MRLMKVGPADLQCGLLIRAGCASQAEVDPSGIEGGQGAKLFGDDQGCVVGEHDAAGADADGFRSAGDVADDDGGGGAGDAGHVVVLGEPEAAVVEALGVAGEVEGAVEGVGGSGTLGDGGEIEDGERDHGER